MFPSSDVLLSTLRQRIESSLSPSLNRIAAIAPQNVVFRTNSRISKTFPTIKLQVAHSPNDIYDIEALLDSGATATYVSPSFVEDHEIPTQKLNHPTYAYNADDTLNATAITHRAKLTCWIDGHVSTEWFFVTNIGSKDMIIGMTWLRSHNPEIDWRTGKITFDHCPPKCRGRGSLKETLDAMIDDASEITNYSTHFHCDQVYHRIRSKEHAATKWAVEDFKNKKVLTLDDIRNGPFAEYVDVFDE